MKNFVVIIAICLGLSGCTTPGPEPREISQEPAPQKEVEKELAEPKEGEIPMVEDSEKSVKKATFGSTVFRANGERVWEVRADGISWDPERKKGRVEGGRFVLSEKDKTLVLEIEAPDIEIDTESKELRFEGGVKANRNRFQDHIEAKKMVWSQDKQKLYGSKGVIWQGEGFYLQADQFMIEKRTDEVELKGNVKAKVGSWQDLERVISENNG